MASHRPDYQDILLGMKLWIWLQDGDSGNSLVEEVIAALGRLRRGAIQRYGGLSLGESTHLVNEVSIKIPDTQGRYLWRDREGYYHLTVWVHHPRYGGGETRMERFSILRQEPLNQPPFDDDRWLSIGPG